MIQGPSGWASTPPVSGGKAVGTETDTPVALARSATSLTPVTCVGMPPFRPFGSTPAWWILRDVFTFR